MMGNPSKGHVYMEEWRTIISFPLYEISSEGRVRNKTKGHEFKPGSNQKGYRFINLLRDEKLAIRVVHRLVMATFVCPLPMGYEVNHKNGDKSDNRLDSLEYVTHRQNMIHARDVLSVGNKLSIDAAKDIRIHLSNGVKQHILAAHYGVNRATISHVKTGKTWKE